MASPAPSRIPTNGWSKIPNSFIENQHIFTPAEFSFALIVFRKGGESSSVMVTDRNWESWTGRNSRMKEYAIKGLRAKGFEVEGRGNTAKYKFRRAQWEEFVSHSERSKAHTPGRPVGVTPKAGAKIHPACRENGCAMMAREADGKQLTLVSAIQIAQPVAQQDYNPPASGPQSSQGENGSSRAIATRIAQPVAQIHDTAEQVWKSTLATLREFFPMVGVVFLARLIAQVCAIFSAVTDQELAAAVAYAWQQKNRKSVVQYSEGLFLLTVPAALAALRRAPKPPPGKDLAEGAARLLERVERALRGRGAPIFDEFARRAQKLREEAPTRPLEDLYRDMSRLETEIGLAAPGALNKAERDCVSACVEAARHDWDFPESSDRDRAMFRELVTSRETLKALMIPSLSGGYA